MIKNVFCMLINRKIAKITLFLLVFLSLLNIVYAGVSFDSSNCDPAPNTNKIMNSSTLVIRTEVDNSAGPTTISIQINDSIGRDVHVIGTSLVSQFVVGGGYYAGNFWNLTVSQVGTYAIYINASESVGNQTNMTFNITANQSAAPQLAFTTSDVATNAYSIFSVNAATWNNGTGIQPDYNASFLYNSSLFSFINCSPTNCTLEDSGDYIKAYINKSNLNTAEYYNITFYFNATNNTNTPYTSTLIGDAYGYSANSTITVNPAPTYGLNITEIYNSTPSILQLSIPNMTINLPLKINNTGNQNLTDISIVFAVNGTQLNGATSTLNVAQEYATNFTYKFISQGIYAFNVTVNGSNNANGIDSKLVNITYSFNDADNDTYYALEYGGTDCNDTNNDITIIVGGACSLSGYTGSTYDASCVCSGGTAVSSGGGGGGGSSGSTYSYDLSNGEKEFRLRLKDTLKFEYNGIWNILKISNINGELALLNLNNNEFTVKETESKTADAENGLVEITAKEVSSSYIIITLKGIETPIPAETIAEITPEEPVKTTGGSEITIEKAKESSPQEIVLSGEKTEIILKENGIAVFKINGESHGLKLNSITKDSVTLTFASEPQTIDIKLGEKAEVDLNKDGNNDVSVSLNSIDSGSASLSIAEINQDIQASDSTIQKVSDNMLTLGVGFIAVVALILAIGWIVLFRKR